MEEGLGKEEVTEFSIQMASLMFETAEYGLDVSIKQLEEDLKNYPVSKVIQILVKCKLARSGDGRFSFTHRRFNEYFIVKSFLNGSHQVVPIEDIPENKRYRDALVLYCEVADDFIAQKAVSYCLSYILPFLHDEMKHELDDYKKAIHCLRFLVDAFKARKEVLNESYSQLYDFIKNQTQPGKNLIVRKHAIEATVLLKQEHAEEIIDRNFFISDSGFFYNSYLMQAVLDSSKYLNVLSDSLVAKFIVYYGSVGLTGNQILTPMKLKDKMKLLSVSEAFQPVKKFLRSYLIEGFLVFSILYSLVILLVWALLEVDNLNLEAKLIPIFFIFLPLLFYPTLYLFIPSVSLSYNYFRNKKSFKRKAGIIVAAILLGSVSVCSFGEKLLRFAFDPSGGLWITAGLMIAFLIYSGILFVHGFLVLKRMHERGKYYKKILEEGKARVYDGMPREIIEKYFYAIDHARHREDFVRYLKKKEIVPIGNWSNGMLPNSNDDDASGLLAELEEKWLGLEK